MVCMVKKSCKSFWCLRGHGVKFFSIRCHLKNWSKIAGKVTELEIQPIYTNTYLAYGTAPTDAVPSQCVHPRRGRSGRNGRSSLHLRGRALYVRRDVLRMEQWHMRRGPEQIQRRHVGTDHLL